MVKRKEKLRVSICVILSHIQQEVVCLSGIDPMLSLISIEFRISFTVFYLNHHEPGLLGSVTASKGKKKKRFVEK